MKPNAATSKLIEIYLTSLDCPRSLSVLLMFRNNEHKQIAELDCNPNDYGDYDDFHRAYQATKFLSKSNFLSTNLKLKDIALEKFLAAEDACRLINLRGFHWTVIKQQSSEWLHNAIIRKIDRLLGDIDGDELIDSCNWGPGVSLDVKEPDTSPANKFHLDNGTTRPLDDLMGHLYAVAYPTWDLTKRKYHLGNKIVTVPKNSKTDRTIAIEPGLNLWIQKGIGTMIGRRLLRVGQDLSDQRINQQKARLGSKFSQLATVDFSSASDTISIATVEALLPPRWFTLLDLARSRYGSIEGRILRYEKFSSMGNGFTFQLESLIFWAIASAVCEYLQIHNPGVSVYGDDVIIPTKAFDLYVKTCAFYGFTINQSKSYASGYFRESCGAHWFDGIDCKPIFLKENIKDDLSLYKVANALRRKAHNRSLGFCDSLYKRSWLYVVSLIKRKLYISDTYGDGGICVNLDEASPIRAQHSIEGWFTMHFAFIPRRYERFDTALLLARVRWGSPQMDFNNWVHLRNRGKYSRKRLFIRQWYDLGPWI